MTHFAASASDVLYEMLRGRWKMWPCTRCVLRPINASIRRQNAFAAGLRPDTAGGTYCAPPDPVAGFWGGEWRRGMERARDGNGTEGEGNSLTHSWRVDSWGPLRRLSTMSTLLCTLPHLFPAGCCSVANLLYPCLSRSTRKSLPFHTWAAARFHCNDLLQGLVCRYAAIQSDYVPE